MSNLDLDRKLPIGSFIYVGRRIMRNDAEPQYKKEEALELNPESYPHTFIDFSGASMKEVMIHAGGKQGCVVDTQKIVREGSTLNEVLAWRKEFENMEEIPVSKLPEYVKGEPFVIINFQTAGTALDVPVQAADMLIEIERDAIEIWNMFFIGETLERQLEIAPGMYETMKTFGK